MCLRCFLHILWIKIFSIFIKSFIKVLQFYNPSQMTVCTVWPSSYWSGYFISVELLCISVFKFKHGRALNDSNTHLVSLELSANSPSMRMMLMTSMIITVVLLMMKMSPHEACAFSMGGRQSKAELDAVFSASVSLVMVEPVIGYYYWLLLFL